MKNFSLLERLVRHSERLLRQETAYFIVVAALFTCTLLNFRFGREEKFKSQVVWISGS